VLKQLKRRQRNWPKNRRRRNDDNIVKQSLPWTPYAHGVSGKRDQSTPGKNLEIEMWTAGFKLENSGRPPTY